MSKTRIDAADFYLRPPHQGDIDVITRACQDELIQRFTTIPTPYTEDSARWWIDQVGQQSEQEKTWLAFTYDDELIGVVGLEGFMEKRRETTIGYWGSPDFRGKGLMEQICRVAIEDGWRTLPIDRITWSAHVGNIASWVLAWKMGFVFEGIRRQVHETPDRTVDMWTASLLRDDPMAPNCDVREPQRFSASFATGEPAERPYDPRRPQALVHQFHEVYGLPILLGERADVDIERINMRMGLISEEYAELVGAVYGRGAREIIERAQVEAVATDDGTRDTIESADALADLIYVVYGMGLETGIDLDAVLDEVQASNLSKLGADGKPIYREDGKVLKGPGFFNPNIARALGLDEEEDDPR